MPAAAPTRTGRRVVVTGASSGIGRACAHRLAEAGDRLVLTSRSPEVLAEVAAECLARGAADAIVVPADVGEREAVEHLFAEALARYGEVDAVIHAAAVVAYGRFEEVPADVFDRALRTNLTGTANVARCALQAFDAAGGGSLVVVGSVLGKMVAPLMSPYSTGKWAVHALTRTLQVEARRRPGVEVTLVSPGSINTPIYDQAGSWSGHGGHPPPPVAGAERAAAKCVRALDRPRREVDVGPFNKLMVAGFRFLPPVYDVLVGPLMARFGQGSAAVDPHPGNVLEPRPEGEAVDGRWPRVWG